MAQKTPEQIAEKYQRGVSGAGSDYAAGVQNPSRSWAEATRNSEGRWWNGLQEAQSERRFSAGIQRAGDAKWQQNALEKGQARYTQAASQAASAYRQVAGDIMAAAERSRAAAASMPGDTQDQRIQKAVAAMKATSDFWKQRRRG
jgi:hypothetical protein